MNAPKVCHGLRPWRALALLWALSGPLAVAAPPAPGPGPGPGEPARVAPAPPNGPDPLLPRAERNPSQAVEPPLPPAGELLDSTIRPIDLNTALRLAGVQNPELMIARQRTVEAAALYQLAAAQLLPNINLGGNYDSHSGVLQQSNGNMLSVNRSALYLGAGAGAVAAGTVSIPGLVLSGNTATVIYAILTSRQYVRQREFATLARRNQAFLETAIAYSELLRAEGRRSVANQIREEARAVANQTWKYAKQGQGRKADADRAATELAKREADYQSAEGDVLVASARLARVINIDPSIRLHPTDAWVVPSPIVPDPIPVAELIALALVQRPELAERRAAIRGAFLALQGANVLPFSPTILLGLSAGGFGGGSNLVSPVFGGFGGRTDLDVYAYWTIQNLGVGNAALIRLARSQLRLAEYEQIATLDRVRAEVAEAYALTHTRFAQIGTAERGVRTGTDGFLEDYNRIKSTVVPAIEVVDNLSLLADARYAYLDSIVDYNEAQFRLYVALGQPPADSLARPVPTDGVTAGQGGIAPAAGGSNAGGNAPNGRPAPGAALPPPAAPVGTARATGGVAAPIGR